MINEASPPMGFPARLYLFVSLWGEARGEAERLRARIEEVAAGARAG